MGCLKFATPTQPVCNSEPQSILVMDEARLPKDVRDFLIKTGAVRVPVTTR